jgi:protein ImuB
LGDSGPPPTTHNRQPRSQICGHLRNLRINIWSQKLIHQLELSGLRAQIGIAATPGLALHAARQAAPFLFVKEPEEFLSALPVESLDPPPEILLILRKWGIRTLGALTALGKQHLTERLGPEALELLDQATARQIRPLNLVTPPEIFEETMEFQHEIESLDPLLFVLRRFIDQICSRLELMSLAAEELRLRLTLASGADYEKTFRIPAPTSQADALFRTLHTHLENVRTDAPIIALHLSANPCRSRTHQFDLFEASLRDPTQFHETVARLSSLLGPDRAGTPVVQSSHRPDAFRMQPADFDSVNSARRANREPPSANTIGLCLRRFRPPIPVTVKLQDNLPIFLFGPKLNGRIAAAQGPWRRSGDWWDKDQLWQRDEWDIETADGALYRLYQMNEDWFLEGMYD